MSFREFVNCLFKFTNYRVIKTRNALNSRYDSCFFPNLEMLLSYQLLKSKDFFFVQIGANDGRRADDIYRFVKENNLSGLVIEPLPDMYNALVNNYAECKAVKAVNVAIDKVDGEMTLYRVDPAFKEAPDWCHGIASFDKSHLEKAYVKVPGIREHILEEKVPCMSFSSLAQKYNFKTIDLLQIDTEGYDFEIIKSIDFDIFQPTIVRYEDSGLSPRDSADCLTFFMDRGYKIFEERNDIVALKF